MGLTSLGATGGAVAALIVTPPVLALSDAAYAALGLFGSAVVGAAATVAVALISRANKTPPVGAPDLDLVRALAEEVHDLKSENDRLRNPAPGEPPGEDGEEGPDL